MIINMIDMRMPYFTNHDHVGNPNYLMLNFKVHGRLVYTLDDVKRSSPYGTAVLYHPIDKRYHFYNPTGTCQSIVVGIELSTFEMANGDDLPPADKILGAICRRYR